MRHAHEFSSPRLRRGELSLGEKFWQISWSLVLLVTLTGCVGLVMLYSAAGGDWEPWADRQAVRLMIGFVLMVGIAVVDIRFWIRNAYTFYAVVLVLLVAVEIRGTIGMGAQRWIDLGFFQLQPSEVMKLALVLSLARYYHSAHPDDVRRLPFLIPPALMTLVPFALVLKQPDLGTGLMLVAGAAAVSWLAGVRIWVFALAGIAGLGAIPVAWQFLHDYQKQRVLTFLNPESDPLGSGYHILQSKIALGSGGVFGKGYMNGTQAHLNFLPEKQTDFIFTMLAEEFGMVGGLILLSLYVILLIYGFAIALRCRHQFGRLVALGVSTMFFLYVFINIAMVMGLIPVVGVPLPLISYGGTALLNLMMGFGLLLCVFVHRDVQMGRRGGFDD
ncbi:rod shape-determining protein RodA [Pararhodospirillum oryzae]|uniref:Peptidoglycan glycosyltransferase MrdB n=1 Tax=Pararhodospirillum oryzae TaxID=478448 RepID=A0A512HBA6_9PROT|nr:rod shape-determining protein RodA [Pararhodospirillum oryzae]GEO82670.1 rod shape-determining protein RodA [Pararhodospirillum oryzae]